MLFINLKYTQNIKLIDLCLTLNMLPNGLQLIFVVTDRVGAFMSLLVFSVNITSDGVKAVVHLSKGDMRRSLNILQVGST